MGLVLLVGSVGSIVRDLQLRLIPGLNPFLFDWFCHEFSNPSSTCAEWSGRFADFAFSAFGSGINVHNRRAQTADGMYREYAWLSSGFVLAQAVD